MASLTIAHVFKRFGRTEVLKDINLEVENGEFVVLVGPSGCGKSTLLNLIAGLEDLTQGEIRIGDRLVNQVPPKNRNIAMVFQTYALYPTMTARDNIAFGLSIRKVPRAEQEQTVQRVARMLQIEELLDRRPAQLSGGQRQRVAMGRALARDPEIFLFDEPLSNLDAKLRVEMREEIKKLHHSVRSTIIYVTHDQVEAMTLADRIAIMRGGVIQQLADPATVYSKPANLFVAGFIGSPAMNIVPARLTAEGGALQARIEGDGAEHPALALPLPGAAEQYAGWLDKELLLGLRPEHITQVQGGADNGFHPLQSRVRFLEPTGPDTLVFTTLGKHRVIARVVPAAALPEGSVMDFHVDLSHLLFFDPESGDRIPIGD